MKKPLIIAVITAALAIFGYFLIKDGKDSGAGTLTLYGNVDIRDVSLAFRISGRIDGLHFEEGDRVKAGDVMAVLDKRPFNDELMLAEARLESAAAALAKARAGLRPQEIEQARETVNERIAALTNLEITHSRVSELLKADAISRQEYDDSLAARDGARARLKAAEKALEQALEGYRKEDIDSAQAEYKAAEASVAFAATSLADTELKAPSDGVILTRIREKGAIAAAGAPVYSLALDSPVWIRAYIDEPRLGRIYPGQKAEIFTDTYPNKPYTGSIGFISPQAEFTPKNVETESLRTQLVYRLRIIVDDPDNALRQGMPVTVKIAE